MPAPTNIPNQIRIKTTTGTSAGEKLKLINRTRSQEIEVTLNAKQEVLVQYRNTYTGWVKGDEIIAEIHGRLQGYASGIIDKTGNATLTLNDGADTSTPGIDL